MKVLQIINNLGMGGAEKLISDYTPLMIQKGIEVEILLLTNNKNVYEGELKNNGITIKCTNIDSVYSLKQILALQKEIVGYDLIHTHLFPTQYWYVIASLLTNINTPSVTTEHSTHNKRRDKPIFKMFDRYIYSKYKKIICISEATKENLVKWVPQVEKKTSVINNGIDLNKYKEAKPYLKDELLCNIDADSKFIVMVARMDHQKDHMTLIKAASSLPSNYHILLVGDGYKRTNYETLVQNLSLSNKVHFLGIRNDVNRILKTSDLFVLSSHWEGFGLVAVEAMAAGLPVIVSDVLGLKDVIGDAGLTFTKGDDRFLANQIIKTIEDRKFYQELCEKSLKRASMFSIQSMVDEYINIYNELLQ